MTIVPLKLGKYHIYVYTTKEILVSPVFYLKKSIVAIDKEAVLGAR